MSNSQKPERSKKMEFTMKMMMKQEVLLAFKVEKTGEEGNKNIHALAVFFFFGVAPSSADGAFFFFEAFCERRSHFSTSSITLSIDQSPSFSGGSVAINLECSLIFLHHLRRRRCLPHRHHLR
jgi:hypothetical protein